MQRLELAPGTASTARRRTGRTTAAATAPAPPAAWAATRTLPGPSCAWRRAMQKARRPRPSQRCQATRRRSPRLNPIRNRSPATAADHANRAGEQHDRRKRPAINGGALHQGADGLQILFGPVRIPCRFTLHHKAIFGKRKSDVAAFGRKPQFFRFLKFAALCRDAATVKFSVFSFRFSVQTFSMPPPRKIPARQRVLAQWRGVDLSPLETAKAVRARRRRRRDVQGC